MRLIHSPFEYRSGLVAIIIRAFIPRKIHDLAFYPRVLSVVHGPISVFHLVKAVTLRTCVSCNNTWYLVVRTFQGFPWPSATHFSVVRRVELFLWRACNFNRCLQAPKHVHIFVWNIYFTQISYSQEDASPQQPSRLPLF